MFISKLLLKPHLSNLVVSKMYVNKFHCEEVKSNNNIRNNKDNISNRENVNFIT